MLFARMNKFVTQLHVLMYCPAHTLNTKIDRLIGSQSVFFLWSLLAPCEIYIYMYVIVWLWTHLACVILKQKKIDILVPESILVILRPGSGVRMGLDWSEDHRIEQILAFDWSIYFCNFLIRFWHHFLVTVGTGDQEHFFSTLHTQARCVRGSASEKIWTIISN